MRVISVSKQVGSVDDSPGKAGLMLGRVEQNPSPQRGRGWPASAGRVRGRGESRFDLGPNTIRILQHIAVPEADHAEALAFEIRRAPCIALGRVLSAIDFDDEALLGAQKINDVSVDFDLATELEAAVLPRTKEAPQFSLSIRGVEAQRSRSCCRMVLSCHAPSARSIGPTLSRAGERVSSESRRIHA